MVIIEFNPLLICGIILPGHRKADWTCPRLASIATLVVAGYGIQTFALRARDRHIAEAHAAETRDAERRRHNEALMDEYGDRSSLAELERAVRFYEKKP